ncbi:hypothetical protein FD23_GL001726 [Lactobacillus delbrueckii subsp. delbrueckii DSM 20074 = JCM 1012]|nr:hypothetical protein FD23_GL001726 [Lactobacillus delbrueckii subsp. delbrueckii DSM 20074 = JCM 1012]
MNFFAHLRFIKPLQKHDWNVLCNCKLKNFLQESFGWQPFAGI